MTLRQPPEWAPHQAVWIGWPSHAELWEENLLPARAEVARFAEAVRAGRKGERVILVAADAAAAESARAVDAQVHIADFGDVWLRDTGPIILTGDRADGSHHREAVLFRFNGWGGKYEFPEDRAIGARLARHLYLPHTNKTMVLEGGAIDVDGTGFAVTTEQCLLNPNRNPDLDRADIAGLLHSDLGLDRILWLGDGLLNDHTDGHVDNLARFVAPGRLAIPVADAADDPNAGVYRDARARAEAFGVEVVPLPSPGRIERDGEIVPASYMNFYIGNAAVVVPLWGVANDPAAINALAALLPDREIVGVRGDHLLTGGGSFHCISQQVPT